MPELNQLLRNCVAEAKISGATSTFVRGGAKFDLEGLGENFSKKTAVFRIWSKKQHFWIVDGLALIIIFIITMHWLVLYTALKWTTWVN